MNKKIIYLTREEHRNSELFYLCNFEDLDLAKFKGVRYQQREILENDK